LGSCWPLVKDILVPTSAAEAQSSVKVLPSNICATPMNSSSIEYAKSEKVASVIEARLESTGSTGSAQRGTCGSSVSYTCSSSRIGSSAPSCWMATDTWKTIGPCVRVGSRAAPPE
jgi:hypothetical protein